MKETQHMSIENAEDIATADDIKAALAPKEKKQKVAKAPKEPKTPREKTARQPTTRGDVVPGDAVVNYGVDKDGVAWSPEHPPCREGTKRHDRFSLIRPDMTVKELVEAGLENSNVRKYSERGWITLT